MPMRCLSTVANNDVHALRYVLKMYPIQPRAVSSRANPLGVPLYLDRWGRLRFCQIDDDIRIPVLHHDHLPRRAWIALLMKSD